MAFKAQLLHFPTKASYERERKRNEDAGTLEQFKRYLSFVDEGPTLYTWGKEYNSITPDVLKKINGQSILENDITIPANVQTVDTGDIIDDVAVDYATKTYVDGLIGDVNSVLESIINS